MCDYVVSFCVPVYHNAVVACQIARDLLANKDNRFQVVISNNESGDDTVSRLQEISDSRLKIYTHERTKPLLNWYHALENGDGRFLYLVMGRDKLKAENISDLIERLLWAEKNDIALIRDREEEDRVFDRFEAYYFLCMEDHPTGLILKREVYREIELRRTYFETFDTYPEIGIKGEIIRHHKAAALNCGVFSNRLYIDRMTVKSRFDEEGESQFFFPERRFKQMCNIIDVIVTDKRLTQKERERLVLTRCYLLFKQVSIKWKEALQEDLTTKHYGLEKRYVSAKEQVRNVKYYEKKLSSYMRKKYSWFNVIMRLKVKREAIVVLREVYQMT